MTYRHPSLLLPIRTFSTTCHPLTNRTRPAKILSSIPPYPYPPSQWYKQSNNGLYGGAHIQFGNIISERENKSRRRWKPNIQHKRLWSVALDRFVRVKVATRTLRTIDKCGGLDEYLLGDKPARIKELGIGGWKLRWRVMQTEMVRKRWNDERRRLGLQPEGEQEEEEGGDGGIMGQVLKRDLEEFDQALDKAEGEVAVGEQEEGEIIDIGDQPAGQRPV